MKIEFFEPPMCCSTGLCGPSVDKRLVRLNENINYLKDKYKHIEIHRYMISQQPVKFATNKEVFTLVKQHGRSVLPISTFNGKVFKTKEYPTLEEMENLIRNEY